MLNLIKEKYIALKQINQFKNSSMYYSKNNWKTGISANLIQELTLSSTIQHRLIHQKVQILKLNSRILLRNSFDYSPANSKISHLNLVYSTVPKYISLTQKLKSEISEQQAISIIVQLSIIFRFIYGKKLSHGDVRPSNILICGINNKVYIRGFNLINQISQKDEEEQLRAIFLKLAEKSKLSECEDLKDNIFCMLQKRRNQISNFNFEVSFTQMCCIHVVVYSKIQRKLQQFEIQRLANLKHLNQFHIKMEDLYIKLICPETSNTATYQQSILLFQFQHQSKMYTCQIIGNSVLSIAMKPDQIQEEIELKQFDQRQYEDSYQFQYELQNADSIVQVKQQNRQSLDPANQNIHPFNSIGCLLVKLSNISQEGSFINSFGSGSLVYKSLVLTCAHNLFRFQKQNKKFYKCLKPEDAVFKIGNRTIKVKGIEYPKQFQQCFQPSFTEKQYRQRIIARAKYDYALILLQQEVQNYLNLIVDFSQKQQKNCTATFGGYQKNKQKNSYLELIKQKKVKFKVSQGELIHQATTDSGNSGGPLLVQILQGISGGEKHYSIIGFHIKVKKTKEKENKSEIINQNETIKQKQKKKQNKIIGIHFNKELFDNLKRYEYNFSKTNNLQKTVINYKNIILNQKSQFEESIKRLQDKLKQIPSALSQLKKVFDCASRLNSTKLILSQLQLPQNKANYNKIAFMSLIKNIYQYKTDRVKNRKAEKFFVALFYLGTHLFRCVQEFSVKSENLAKFKQYKSRWNRQITKYINDEDSRTLVKATWQSLFLQSQQIIKSIEVDEVIRLFLLSYCSYSKQVHLYFKTKKYDIKLTPIFLFCVKSTKWLQYAIGISSDLQERYNEALQNSQLLLNFVRIQEGRAKSDQLVIISGKYMKQFAPQNHNLRRLLKLIDPKYEGVVDPKKQIHIKNPTFLNNFIRLVSNQQQDQGNNNIFSLLKYFKK